jgi:MFS family permease
MLNLVKGSNMKDTKQNSKFRYVVPASVLLIVLCIAGFLDGMDVSSMGVILPVIQHNLHISTQALQWIISGYVLGYGGFMLLGGRVADLYGRRHVFLISMALFALASLAGGLADTGWLVIATRIIKGICAGFTAPAALSLLLGLYSSARERNRALGIFSSTSAIGFAMGVAIGGFLGDISWRLAFFLPIPFALAVVAVGVVALPPDKIQEGKMRFDLLGAILGTAALLAIVFGATQAATYGWIAAASVGPLLLGVVLLLGFLAYERKIQNPLMPLSIFKRPGLGFASIMAFFMQGNYVAYQFVAALYLQTVVGWSSSQTAFAFVFAGLIVVFAATRFAKLAHRIGSLPVVVIGMTLEMLGFAWFLAMRGHISILLLIAVTQLFIGSGVAAALPAINITGLAKAREAEQGLASGIILSAFQIGGGLVVAIVGSIFAASSNNVGSAAYTIAMSVVVGLALAAALYALATWQKTKKQNNDVKGTV